MMMLNENWAGAGSAIASFMFIWAMANRFFPHQFETCITRYTSKIVNIFYPYVVITFHEYRGEGFASTRSEAYAAIESYLSDNCTKGAKRLKADRERDSRKFRYSMDEYEEVSDEYEGAIFTWQARKSPSKRQSLSLYSPPDDPRVYKLVYHQSFRNNIDSYLEHVMEQGKAVQTKTRGRKLYINNPQQNGGRQLLQWSHVSFEHPATFKTVAIDPDQKEKIVQDLLTFSESKDYYVRIGKPWKRGYLLYGPPGTGKSTMIAAMADMMNYDVYDLELTAVMDNMALKKLLIETTSKSIIVIEDIDCSLDLSGRRNEQVDENSNKSEEDILKEKMKNKAGNDGSKVTLSGLLNVIDGLWSACVSERLFVFTTNYKDKLDEALIRAGRMDMHIELSYCKFEAFKILARNYLYIDHHESFSKIEELIMEHDITPADVAEKLMRKGNTVDWVEKCLDDLIKALTEIKVKKEAVQGTEQVISEGETSGEIMPA